MWKLSRLSRYYHLCLFILKTEGAVSLLRRAFNKSFLARRGPEKITAKFPKPVPYHCLTFNSPRQVSTSIIVPACGHSHLDVHCLSSLKHTIQEEACEVLLVFDPVTEPSAALLQSLPGVKPVRAEGRTGFYQACQLGAEQARGEYLVFLDSRTEVRPAWLQRLKQTFEYFPDAALVGPSLLKPNGKLIAAGFYILQDASGLDDGSGHDGRLPAYGFCREVDYCGGPCLMIKRQDFFQAGGFDDSFSLSPYAEMDLSLRLLGSGKKTYCQNAAKLICFGERAPAGSQTGKIAEERSEFQHRWHDQLRSRPAPGTLPQQATADRSQKKILVIDSQVLMPDHDSGSLRMFSILIILIRMGYNPSFIANNLAYHPRYTSDMQAAGIRCLFFPHPRSLSAHLKKEGKQYEAVILSRADVAARHIVNVRQYCPQAKVLFDTVDLHFLREQRLADLTHSRRLQEAARRRKQEEIDLARKADLTLVVSPREVEIFKQEAPDVDVALLSNVHRNEADSAPFQDRADILFIGNFKHPPNIDAIDYFTEKIFPLIQQAKPEIRLHVIGANPPGSLQEKANENILIHGGVADIKPLFRQVRLSVAPLRYGSGVKGKINTSMALGVPVVATEIAAEGMALEPDEDVLIADGEESFARQVLTLYDDASLWQKLSEAGKKNIDKHFSFAVAEQELKKILA